MIESNKQQDKSSHDSIIESINETLKVIDPNDDNYIYKKHPEVVTFNPSIRNRTG